MDFAANCFLGVYLGVMLLHLYCCLKNCGRMRAVTKILLMPLLAGFYLLKTGRFDLTALAILFGWGGDILLLFSERQPCFLGGLSSFLLGHICYTAVLWNRSGGVSGAGYGAAVSAGVLLLIAAAAYASLSRYVGAMKLPVVAYLTAIAVMAFAASLVMLKPAVVALIGSAGLSILLMAVFGGNTDSIWFLPFDKLDWISAAIFAVCLLILWKSKKNPLLIMGGAGVVGMVVYPLIARYGG